VAAALVARLAVAAVVPVAVAVLAAVVVAVARRTRTNAAETVVLVVPAAMVAMVAVAVPVVAAVLEALVAERCPSEPTVESPLARPFPHAEPTANPVSPARAAREGNKELPADLAQADARATGFCSSLAAMAATVAAVVPERTGAMAAMAVTVAMAQVARVAPCCSSDRSSRRAASTWTCQKELVAGTQPLGLTVDSSLARTASGRLAPISTQTVHKRTIRSTATVRHR